MGIRRPVSTIDSLAAAEFSRAITKRNSEAGGGPTPKWLLRSGPTFHRFGPPGMAHNSQIGRGTMGGSKPLLHVIFAGNPVLR